MYYLLSEIQCVMTYFEYIQYQLQLLNGEAINIFQSVFIHHFTDNFTNRGLFHYPLACGHMMNKEFTDTLAFTFGLIDFSLQSLVKSRSNLQHRHLGNLLVFIEYP